MLNWLAQIQQIAKSGRAWQLSGSPSSYRQESGVKWRLKVNRIPSYSLLPAGACMCLNLRVQLLLDGDTFQNLVHPVSTQQVQMPSRCCDLPATSPFLPQPRK
uniref:Uncharacterized protein n=1 Tax=Colobus angolensis palliatus TaxID=336983 RepID=A0A2K5K3E2_COLAP